VSRNDIAVSEIFGPVLQGEGPVLGEPTVFVRTGGCDLRCEWCDSLHAVLPQHKGSWRSMVAEEIMEVVCRLAPKPLLVTLSGGNPAMQPCGPLIDVGKAMGYWFCAETQGTIAPEWFAKLDVLVLSPKPPSSGMTMDWGKFDRCLRAAFPGGLSDVQVALKVPIFTEADLDWVEAEVSSRHGKLPLYLSVGNPYPPGDAAVPSMSVGEASITSSYPRGALDDDIQVLRMELLDRHRWLADEVLRRRLRARVTPQMHVLQYGNARQR